MTIRQIPENLPNEIYKKANERYFDVKTGYRIAVRSVTYKAKVREMIVVYEEMGDVATIITIHPLKAYERQARVRSGRWEKL